MNETVYWLHPDNLTFPPPEYALKEPNGLIAAGGDLSSERLIEAYSQGIFPWYSEGDPILWWSPDPRSVVFPAEFKPSKSLKKLINKGAFTVKMNTSFEEIIEGCASPRENEDGTWINDDILAAYKGLHKIGFAHSFETWQDGKLVGGLYGIAIGKAFFGESMFSRVSNASKVAFEYMCRTLSQNDFLIVDCQIHNSHLESLGAKEIPRSEFLDIVKRATAQEASNE
jgi:leucyl/phenylalanyl-tRNA--protein transferase